MGNHGKGAYQSRYSTPAWFEIPEFALNQSKLPTNRALLMQCK